MGVYVPANGQLQSLGISMVDSDFYGIAEQLREYDEYLGIGWIPEYKTFAVIRCNPLRPYDEPLVLRMCYQEDGVSPRIPDGRDLRYVQEGDMQRKGMTYEKYLGAREKVKEKKEADWQEFNREAAKDLTQALAIDKVIHAPRVSMHVSEREKKARKLQTPGDKA